MFDQAAWLEKNRAELESMIAKLKSMLNVEHYGTDTDRPWSVTGPWALQRAIDWIEDLFEPDLTEEEEEKYDEWCGSGDRDEVSDAENNTTTKEKREVIERYTALDL